MDIGSFVIGVVVTVLGGLIFVWITEIITKPKLEYVSYWVEQKRVREKIDGAEKVYIPGFGDNIYI